MRLIPSALSALVLVACSSTPGGQPHDASVAGHEAMAAREDSAAAVHASQYNPAAVPQKIPCGPGFTSGACWKSVENPTTAHMVEAERHRKMAAEHRAASQVLRDAEATACAGLSDLDRDLSPFAHREDILEVVPLHVTRGYPEGAIVTFRAAPGLTAPWLQRVVDCHLARNAVLGHDAPEMQSCPLVPKGITAIVMATDAGFKVAIRANDAASAQEVLKRAQALVGR